MTPHDPEADDDRGPRTSLSRPLVWVAVAAVAVRLPHLLETVGSVFFGVPILDEVFYDLVARRLAEGASVADVNPGFRTLLYPALLALCRRLATDHGLFLAVACQHLLGIVTCLLITWFAGRLFRSPLAAGAAGLLYAFAGPPLYFEGRLLITSLFTSLFVLLLVVTGSCRPAGTAGHHLAPWMAAGALVAVAVQARPNALALLLAFPAVALLASGPVRASWQRHRPWLAAWAAAATTLVLLAALQAPWIGSFHPLPAAGGINLYLGNERGADGLVPRQDRHAVYGDVYRDSVQLFAAEEFYRAQGRHGSPSEVSRYWLLRTVDEFLADPLGRMALLARKVWLLVWPPEVPSNLAYRFVAEHESAVLRWLPVRWLWLLPLAAAGGWLACRRRHLPDACDGVRLAWLVALGGLHAATVVAFFVAGRFRIPLWPVAAILAAGVVAAWARRDVARRDAFIAAALSVAVFAAGQVTWPGVALPSQARDFFYRSVAREQAGDLDGALRDARRALEWEPTNPQALFQLGTLALAQEDWQLAATTLLDASRLLHVEPRPFNNLGIALERLGHFGDAYAAYLRAIDTGPDFSPAWVNAALLELRAGRPDLAAAKIQRAEELEQTSGRSTVYTLAARAFLERDRGDDEAAAAAWAQAEARSPDIARRLLQDNARKLRIESAGQRSAGDRSAGDREGSTD